MTEATITGKVVAITGASSGIGEAPALHLAERGAKVVLGACRQDRVNAVVERIAAAGRTERRWRRTSSSRQPSKKRPPRARV